MSTGGSPNLSPVKQAFMALEKLQAKLDAAEYARTEPIAIVGAACRMPGDADTPDEFWKMLCAGTDTIKEVPADRWSIEETYDPDPAVPNKMNSRYGAFVRDLRKFDPDFFGVSPREALTLDPQHRMLLETSWEALEDAAISPDSLYNSDTGVFVGIASFDYSLRLLASDIPTVDPFVGLGNCHAAAAGRISYFFGLQGPCTAVDTACSSSLVSVQLACQAIRTGECRVALAGGTNALLGPLLSINFSKARMLAPDGRCKTFDAAADGYVRGEGAGMLVLKRLSDAIADGDPIRSVIYGAAMNQDGPSGGLTVPNGTAQENVIRRALAQARLQPHQVGAIEAHGTGTQLGDPIELGALARVYCQDRKDPLWVGSAKTNIGHLEASAGVAGLIKATWMLQNRTIPPHLHFKKANPHANWANGKIQVPRELTPWKSEGTRYVGISSFGFTGTNAHIILGEAPKATTASANYAPDGPATLRLSARNEKALREMARRYRDTIAAWASQGSAKSSGEIRLRDVAESLANHRAALPYGASIRADNLQTAVELLDQLAQGNTSSPKIETGRHGPSTESLDFGPGSFRRLRFPFYPFQKQDYYVTPTPEGAERHKFKKPQTVPEHILLGANEPSSNGRLLFRPNWSQPRLDWLQDHRFGGAAVFPASGYVELMAATRGTLDDSSPKSVMVRDIKLLRALPLDSTQSERIEVTIDRHGADANIELRSKPGASGSILHAQGTVGEGDYPAWALQPTKATKQLAKQAANDQASPSIAGIYDVFQQRGLQYGERFRALSAVDVGENEVACIVRLPSSMRSDAGDYLLHPVLLDACFQALLAKLDATLGQHAMLPVAIDRVYLRQSTGTEAIGYLRLTSQRDGVMADVAMFDKNLQPIAALEGVRLQRIAAMMDMPHIGEGGPDTAPSVMTPLKEELLALPEEEQQSRLVSFLQEQLVKLLRHEQPELPDPTANLFQVGVDSLIAVEWVYEINRGLGIRLPVETLLTRTTIASLAGELVNWISNKASAGGGMAGESAGTNIWIAPRRIKPAADHRVFCFHHLGGEPSLFAEWNDAMPGNIEVCAVQVPGRGDRAAETPIDHFETLIDELADGLLDELDRPFAFFAHSAGCLVAYEVAQLLRRRFGLQPERMFMGASMAPDAVMERVSSGFATALGEPNDPRLKELFVAAGASANTPERQALMVADAEIFASWRNTALPPLDCGMTVFGGKGDRLVKRDDLLGWAKFALGDFHIEMVEGDHGSYLSQRDRILRRIASDLAAGKNA
jgi:acyl transferase domain-containing protein/surfactin synthase thioesterase subunit